MNNVDLLKQKHERVTLNISVLEAEIQYAEFILKQWKSLATELANILKEDYHIDV